MDVCEVVLRVFDGRHGLLRNGGFSYSKDDKDTVVAFDILGFLSAAEVPEAFRMYLRRRSALGIVEQLVASDYEVQFTRVEDGAKLEFRVTGIVFFADHIDSLKIPELEKYGSQNIIRRYRVPYLNPETYRKVEAFLREAGVSLDEAPEWIGLDDIKAQEAGRSERRLGNESAHYFGFQ